MAGAVGFVGKLIVGVVTSYALNSITNKLFGPKKKNTSPTYSIGTLQTQTNSGMVMPIIYGKVKCAGNNLWQSDEGKTVQRLVGFGLGRDKGVSDVRLDDRPIGECPGCSYTAYMGDGYQLIDSRVGQYYETVDDYGWRSSTSEDPPTWQKIGSHKELRCKSQEAMARIVGGMKYDAYLALTITGSDKISSNPNTTAIWEGRIVRIYDTPTSYHEDWSDNLWCILDFMTSPDGCNIPIEDMDIQSFITAAAYAQPGDGKRHWSINLILDEKKSRQDWLNEMLLCFRAWRTYQNGKHGILIDKPEPVSQIFKVKKTESIQHDWQPLSEDIERIILQYRDPDYEWTQVGAPATIKPPFRNATFNTNGTVASNGTPLSKTVEINGITNFKQASQHSWFYVNKAQTCQDRITYTCNKRALNRTIGDVVGIEDPITQVHEPSLSYKRYRIMAMTEPQGMQIQMYMEEYNEALYTDAQGSVAPVVNVTKLSNPAKIPPQVTNLRLDEYGWMNKDGTHVSNIDVYWDEVSYQHLSGYIVSISEDEGKTWRTIGPAWQKLYRINNVSTGRKYLVGVQTQNKLGLLSDRVITSIVITGKDNPPGDVPKLTVTQTGDKLVAMITQVDEPDIDLYELRKGFSWENSVLVGRFSNTKYIFDATEEGTLTFWVKAIDNSENPSKNATKAMCNVFGLTPKNIIFERNEDILSWYPISMYFSPWCKWKISSVEKLGDYKRFDDIFESGMQLRNDAEILLSVIDLGPNIIEDGFFYIDPWGNIKIKSVEKLGDYERFGDIFGSGIHLQPVKYIAETFVSVDVKYNQSVNNRVNIEYRTSIDGKYFGEWIPGTTKQFFGRYVQIRLLPKSLDGIINVEISSVKLVIDVPDVEEIIENIDIPAAKTRVKFKRKFFVKPSSIALFTCDLTGKQATWRMTNLTPDYFDLELLDGNNLITGKLQRASIRGY